jgi:hypothetical protein
VIAHLPPAHVPLAVETGDRTAKNADHRWLLLIEQRFLVREAMGIVDGSMDPAVADALGAALLPISAAPVADLTGNLASDLISPWICSPGRSPSYRCPSYHCTGGFGSRDLSRPSPGR